MKARTRYNQLTTDRATFLDVGLECAKLTLPYLLVNEGDTATHRPLKTPWQSVGAKSVTTLASKLMLALLPPQTTFFKLQVRDDKLGEELDPLSVVNLTSASVRWNAWSWIASTHPTIVLWYTKLSSSWWSQAMLSSLWVKMVSSTSH